MLPRCSTFRRLYSADMLSRGVKISQLAGSVSSGQGNGPGYSPHSSPFRWLPLNRALNPKMPLLHLDYVYASFQTFDILQLP
jgi:hypothetical protein